MNRGIGERLKMARRMADMSQDALAQAVGVSKMAISKYEHEKMVPGSDVLIALADALHQPIGYFLRGPVQSVVHPVYRGRKTLHGRKEEMITAQLEAWLERYLTIESLLPDTAVVFTYPEGFPWSVATLDDVDAAADALRNAWHLGDGPLENLTELLEEQGIKVGLVDGNDHFDACLFQLADGSPVVAVKKEMTGDRQRFSLAHELGHLMLDLAHDVDEEKAANRFAGAFLLPAHAVRYELGEIRHALEPRELLSLKHKYGVSMQAWAYRARDLGILGEQAYQSFNKMMNRRRWRTDEPGDPLPPEEPQRMLRLVLRALSEDVIGRTRAEELLGMSWTELTALPHQQLGEPSIAVRA